MSLADKFVEHCHSHACDLEGFLINFSYTEALKRFPGAKCYHNNSFRYGAGIYEPSEYVVFADGSRCSIANPTQGAYPFRAVVINSDTEISLGPEIK